MCHRVPAYWEINDLVRWKNNDRDIPPRQTGVVVGFTDDDRVRVKFPSGTWAFKRNALLCPQCPGWDEIHSDIQNSMTREQRINYEFDNSDCD